MGDYHHGVRMRALVGIIVAAAVPVTAMAADNPPSRASLADLVRQQAAQLAKQSQQIQALQQRLSKVEAEEQAQHSKPVLAKRAATRPSASQLAANTSGTSSGPAATAQTDRNTQAISELQDKTALLQASASQHSSVDLSDGGPKFVSADGKRSFQIGGRLQFDASTTSGSRYSDKSDGRDISGTEARRLRLDFKGKIADHLHYRLQYDLAGNDASVRAAYIEPDFELAGHEVKLYFGNKYDDRTLSGATSSNNTWFMDRNFVNNAVEPDRGPYGLGVKGKIYGHNWHYSLAVTSGAIGRSNDTSDNVTYMSRVHWNPWRRGPNMVHLGAWGFYEDFDRSDSAVYKRIRTAGNFNDNVRIRSRLLRDPASSQAYGFELATSLGAFAAAAEYGHRHVDQRDSAGGENMAYDAYSVEAGYFLTGEHHGYSHKNGVWKFPHVKNPVTGGGYGAFEIATRYQALSFNDRPNYPGGNGHSTTIGVNWYPADWGRIMLNDILWYTNNRSGDYKGPDHGNTVEARLQVMF
ncbi:OprO/OprP family phosphate-selective porin [Salinisphaera hydrothermalis]|uniref:OprO/OprP family phosphate-selective porin n=1 Tax=Salinisphaera hydrothermalis TaxID=563188 RepID=UPI00333EFB67